MNTSCKECVFAKFDGNFQTGCEFHGRLDLYEKRQRTQLVQWDGEKCYYLIDGYCDACTRPVANMPPMDEVIAVVEKRVGIQNTFLLPMEQDDDKAINHFIEVGLNQRGNVKPELMVVGGPKVSTKFLQDSFLKAGGKLYVGQLLADENLMDFAIQKPVTHLISIFQPGMVIPEDFNYGLNELICHQKTAFSMAKPMSGYHGTVISSFQGKHRKWADIQKINERVMTWNNWHQESL